MSSPEMVSIRRLWRLSTAGRIALSRAYFDMIQLGHELECPTEQQHYNSFIGDFIHAHKNRLDHIPDDEKQRCLDESFKKSARRRRAKERRRRIEAETRLIPASLRSMTAPASQRRRRCTIARAWCLQSGVSALRDLTELQSQIVIEVLRACLKNQHRSAYLTFDQIADKAGCARTTAITTVKILAERGLLFVKRRVIRHGHNAPNHRRRVHYLLEPGWRADAAIQGLGRSHRTHQAIPPLFRPVATDVKGEKRFLSTIARRLDSLGAITRGQRQTGGQGMFRAEDNLESPHARAALHRFWLALARGHIDGTSITEFEGMTGLRLLDRDGSLREELPPMPRFLNRMLALTIEKQNSQFATTCEQLGNAPRTILNRQSGRAAILAPAPSRILETGGGEPRHRLIRPMDNKSISKTDLRTSTWEDAPAGVVRAAWDEEIARLPEFREHTFHLITGLLLPIWDCLGTKSLRIYRLQTDATEDGPGQRLLGRMLATHDLPAFYSALGLDAPQLAPDAILNAVMENGAAFNLTQGLRIRRARVMGSNRIEVTFPQTQCGPDAFQRLKDMGCMTEIINYTRRTFIPANTDSGPVILQRLLASYPPAA